MQKKKEYVCVAQLDRALGYGPRCRGFESSHARKLKQVCFKKANLFFYSNTVTYEQPFYNSKSPGNLSLTDETAHNEILIRHLSWGNSICQK